LSSGGGSILFINDYGGLENSNDGLGIKSGGITTTMIGDR
jgi:hypothetical protein